MCIYQLDFHAVGRPLSLTPITNVLEVEYYYSFTSLTSPVQYAHSVGSIPTDRTPHHQTHVIRSTITQCT